MSKGGSKPGERRGGRQKGTPNKVTADVRALAQEYGPRAIATLASIMENEEQPAPARVSAAKELLDRAYGKSPQPIENAGFEDAAEFLRAIGERLAA